MNKAEQLFRSMFASESDYVAFRLANKVIVGNHDTEVEETGEHYDTPFVRVVDKRSDTQHRVADDKPSYLQYNPRLDIAVCAWIEGNLFTRDGNKPISVNINFGSDVEFDYSLDPSDGTSALWEELFPGHDDWEVPDWGKILNRERGC